MSEQQFSLDTIVFRRTHKGQAVATARKALMDERAFSLLRMVNGYTPAQMLATLAGFERGEAAALFSTLEGQGLIERLA